MSCKLLLSIVLFATVAHGGEPLKQVTTPTVEDPWKLMLSLPGWATGVTGKTGLYGAITHVDVNPSDLFRHADMVASFRGELSKGRFGVTTDFLYLSLSDGIGTKGVIKKLDVQLDQVLGDIGLRWRVIEGPRGWLDVTAGVRYTNLYQKMVTQTDAQQLGGLSDNLVDDVSRSLRDKVAGSDIGKLVALRLSNRSTVADPRGQPVPITPLRDRDGERERIAVVRIIQKHRDELAAALRAVDETVGLARIAARQRVARIQQDVSRKIADVIEKGNNAEAARTDDWFDPYIGLRARYNLTDRLYVFAKGDVGGFSVGSQFTWQAEASLGYQLTSDIFAEAGYRALGVDYQEDNLTYDMITHGAQLTVGIAF